jgi:hypothetical protein
MVPYEQGTELDQRTRRPPPSAPPDPRRERDFWERLEILARPVTAFTAAILVAGLGILGNKALEREQNTRLYTELLSRREESESSLRTSMFTAALDDFFTEPGEDLGEREEAARVRERLLRLEMLALNFGESLSLSPLFLELDRDIQALDSTLGPWWRVNRNIYHERLHSLARRVSKTQLAALAPNGEYFEIKIPVDRARASGYEGGFVWPEDANGEVSGILSLGGVERTYSAIFYGADPENKTVDVRLDILDVASSEVGRPMDFSLSFFDFPMIDNTRLSENQRFAMMVDGWEEGVISITGIVFPGELASHRDKPFLTDAIKNLQNLDETTD